jgi:hypothetical protein
VTSNPGRTVTRNITAAHARQKLSQEQVATKMRDLGFNWRRQTVTQAERRDRRIDITELLGLSITLRNDLTMLVYPSPDDAAYGTVRLPNDELVSLPNGFRLGDARFPNPQTGEVRTTPPTEEETEDR